MVALCQICALIYLGLQHAGMCREEDSNPILFILEKAKSGLSTLTTERGDIATWTATALSPAASLLLREDTLYCPAPVLTPWSWVKEKYSHNAAKYKHRACFLTVTSLLPADWKEQDREKSSSVKNCSLLQCKVPQSWCVATAADNIRSLPTLCFPT